MAVRTRTFPSEDCAFIASTACVYTQAKKQVIFLPGKVAPLLLVGDIPKPLSLAPDTERLNRCRKRQYVHIRPPYGGIHERMDITMKNRTRKHAFLIYLSDDGYSCQPGIYSGIIRNSFRYYPNAVPVLSGREMRPLI